MDDLAGNELFFTTLQEITSLINGGRAQETIFESVLSCALHMLQAQSVELKIFSRRESGFVLPLELHAQHHYDVGAADRLADIVSQGDARGDALQIGRQQGRRAA